MSANLISAFKFAPRLFRKASAAAVASVFLASGAPAHAYGLDDPHDDVFLIDPVEQGDLSPAPKPQRQVSPEEFQWQGPPIALSRPGGTLAGPQADVATLRYLIAAAAASDASVPVATVPNERATATHDENGQTVAKQSTDAAGHEQMDTSRTSVAAMNAAQTSQVADPGTPVRTDQVPDSVRFPDGDRSTEHGRTPESPPRLESAHTSSPVVLVASLADGAKNVASAAGTAAVADTADGADTAGGADTAAGANTTDGVNTAAVAVTGGDAGTAAVAATGGDAGTAAVAATGGDAGTAAVAATGGDAGTAAVAVTGGDAGTAAVAVTGDGADAAAAADTDDARISSTTDSAATIKGKSSQSVETVEVFARKLLQEKLRDEAAKAAAKAAAPSAAPAQLPRNLGMVGPANLELVYIVGQGNRARAYVRIDNQYTRMWEPGEFVAGWRLLEVGSDYVDVMQGDDQSRLYLSSGRKDKVSAR